MTDLSKGKKGSSFVRRLMSRSKRSKEGLSGAKVKRENGANDDASIGHTSTGGISTEEEDEASTGSNEENSLNTISTGVSKGEDDASVDGSFISDTTFEEEENQRRPSTAWRGVSGVGHALRSRASSLGKCTASFIKPLSTVGPTLSNKPRSASIAAGRWFGKVKADAKQRLASRKRRKERERREREWQRRERRRAKREERERERNKIFGRGWKRRLLIKLIVSMYPKGWKCRLGERIRKRIGDLVMGVKRPYVATITREDRRYFCDQFFAREVRFSTVHTYSLSSDDTKGINNCF